MLKAKQKFGKYRIERKLSEGGFATVYRALDTIEGIRVALKVPHPHLLSSEVLNDIRHEVRLSASLDHQNILPLKNASYIDGRFVLAFALGERTLEERLRNRMSLMTAMDLAEQMLTAAAHAHRHRIIHCDIKPDNLILFPFQRLRLSDFGIARVAQRTIRASGSGTMGYMAPEQAMGRPSFRSDVFSLGLILYRMLAGCLPEWPYEWPPPGFARLRRRVHPDLIELIQKAVDLNPRRRFKDADQMLGAFLRIKRRVLRNREATARKGGKKTRRDWQAVRRQQFQQQYGKLLQTHYHCRRCQGPVAEFMHACPWCGVPRRQHEDATRFPAKCPRCRRGMKLDWRYCPWCFGPGFEPLSERQFTDVRYEARCSNSSCPRGLLMRFMRYCPWCRRKTRRKWTLPGSHAKCPRCAWAVLPAFWSFCPWCRKSLVKT